MGNEEIGKYYAGINSLVWRTTINKSVNGCIEQYGFMKMLNIFYHVVLQAEV